MRRLELMRLPVAALIWSLALCGQVSAQFFDGFETVETDPAGAHGWRFFTGFPGGSEPSAEPGMAPVK
jgi:hypothetical protein